MQRCVWTNRRRRRSVRLEETKWLEINTTLEFTHPSPFIIRGLKKGEKKVQKKQILPVNCLLVVEKDIWAGPCCACINFLEVFGLVQLSSLSFSMLYMFSPPRKVIFYLCVCSKFHNHDCLVECVSMNCPQSWFETL